MRIDPRTNNRRRGERKKAKHAVAEMVYREIRDHSFQIALCPCSKRREDDRANGQPEQPRPDNFDFVREQRQQQAHKPVNAHFREHAGEHHRNADRRSLIRVRQPGVKWKQRHFYREPDKDSREREPRGVSRKQAALANTRESREIERAFRQVNPEKRKQHRYASEKCVEEELGRGTIAVFAAPDFDQQKAWDQAHFVEEKPENEILSGERAVERRLHYQNRRVKRTTSVWSRLREQCEWNDQRREQYEQQA